MVRQQGFVTDPGGYCGHRHRKVIPFDMAKQRRFIIGTHRRFLMVTGAGGSIGSELCRQLVNLGLARLILVDHSEYQLFEIQTELAGAEVELVSEVLDVQDVAAITSALNR